MTVVDQFTREAVFIEADHSLSGKKVAMALNRVAQTRPLPQTITVDNGSEVAGKDLDAWAYWRKVTWAFIRPGNPIENASIESFNGRVREECLNQELFESIEEAREKLSRWRTDYNESRPHSSLGHLTPREFAQTRSAQQAAETQIVNPSMA